MRRTRFYSLIAGLTALLIVACGTPARAADGGETGPTAAAGANGQAPEFPTGLDWLNTARPLTISELRGKIVLLDFWTYGCINCIHIIPDLERLEKEYPTQLVIIGVHSAKYSNEALTANIREVILRYGITHPVVNDNGYKIWDLYGAEAWPTLVLVDPTGKIVNSMAGERVYAAFKPAIQSLADSFAKRNLLNLTPLAALEKREVAPDTILAFPGKVEYDAKSDRVFIADSSHNRIVIAKAASGEILDIAGGTDAGFSDGSFADARFNYPQGMALAADGNTLYVADTDNHAIRKLDLSARTVVTFDGTGKQASAYPPAPGRAPSTALSSPWDLALSGSTLFIAMAGSHQIWTADLKDGSLRWLAGSGAEGTRDGDAQTASLAQPSGLSWDGKGRLYFANTEGNAVRWVENGAAGWQVRTLAGSTGNLFDFGDKDGVGTAARFQHPLGVVVVGDSLFVADAYNSKIKNVDIRTGQVVTVAGKSSGWKDGTDPLFDEPGGISAGPGGMLLVADTNNDAIRILDPARNSSKTLVLKGIEKFAFSKEQAPGVKTLKQQLTLAPGKDVIRLTVTVPQGYEVNPQAPFAMQWSADGGTLRLPADASRSITNPAFPLEIPVTADEGTGTLTGDLSIVYCRVDEEGVCMLDRVRIDLPYTVGRGGQSSAAISYAVELPK